MHPQPISTTNAANNLSQAYATTSQAWVNLGLANKQIGSDLRAGVNDIINTHFNAKIDRRDAEKHAQDLENNKFALEYEKQMGAEKLKQQQLKTALESGRLAAASESMKKIAQEEVNPQTQKAFSHINETALKIMGVLGAEANTTSPSPKTPLPNIDYTKFFKKPPTQLPLGSTDSYNNPLGAGGGYARR